MKKIKVAVLCGGISSERNISLKSGEDGRTQALLDLVGVPYTGSKVLASALGMNKIKANDLMEKYEISVPKTFAINKNGYKVEKIIAKIKKKIGFPCVIKPNESGSSVGITIIKKPNELEKAFSEAFKEDNLVLAQEYIKGREITCGVLGNTRSGKLLAMPPVEIIPGNEFFDYDAKYFSKKTHTRDLSGENFQKINF